VHLTTVKTRRIDAVFNGDLVGTGNVEGIPIPLN
jgi:hypothetical protein